MVVLAIVGGSLARLMVHQSRFFDNQRMGRDARSVSRGALNVLVSDLRMVERPTGLIAISETELTARVPYAFGVFCGNSGGGARISLAPVDSLMFEEPGFSGYAWRETTGGYTYVAATSTAANSSATTCANAGITTLDAGNTVVVAPVMPAEAPIGTLVFLYREMSYEFRESAQLPGRIALWRTALDADEGEELIAPFDSTAGFQYFTVSDSIPDDEVPASLASVLGVRLLLHGESDRAARTANAVKRAERVTDIFFMNRPE